jgi:hypothetical protein
MPPQQRPDWERALVAYHEVLDFVKSPRGQSYLKSWVENRRETYGYEHMQPSQVAAAWLDDDLASADAIFVTEEMQYVTYRAMEGFRRSEPVWIDDFFIRNGFAVLAEPFQSLDVKGRKTSWRAISWNVEQMWTIDPKYRDILSERLKTRGIPFGGYMRDLFDTSIRLNEDDIRGIPGAREEWTVRVTLFAHEDDPDDYNFKENWRKEIGSSWLVTHTTSFPFSAIPDIREMRGEGDADAAWLTFLRVLNRLMAEKLISKGRRQPTRPTRRWLLKKNVPIKDVVVIELRRRQQKRSENDGGEHREFSHRFIRHGHWRNQWYPSIGRHRQKYIEDMIIGPEDKPLVLKDRVWNFDR